MLLCWTRNYLHINTIIILHPHFNMPIYLYWRTSTRHNYMCMPKIRFESVNLAMSVLWIKQKSETYDKNEWYCFLAKNLFSNLPALPFINLHCNISLLEECLESEIWRVVECRIVYCLPEKASARVICLLCSDLYSGQHATVTWQHDIMTYPMSMMHALLSEKYGSRLKTQNQNSRNYNYKLQSQTYYFLVS